MLKKLIISIVVFDKLKKGWDFTRPFRRLRLPPLRRRSISFCLYCNKSSKLHFLLNLQGLKVLQMQLPIPLRIAQNI